MAEIACVREEHGEGVVRYKWEGVGPGDTFGACRGPRHADKTVQVTGSLDGGTVTLKGRNDPDAHLWVLKDTLGNSVQFSGADPDGRLVLENPFEIVPTFAGGGGSEEFSVYINCTSGH